MSIISTAVGFVNPAAGMALKQYRSNPGSKQVLRDGQHFADACSPEEAAQVAHAMNEGLAKIVVELGECATCKGVGGHEPGCVKRPKANPGAPLSMIYP